MPNENNESKSSKDKAHIIQITILVPILIFAITITALAIVILLHQNKKESVNSVEEPILQYKNKPVDENSPLAKPFKQVVDLVRSRMNFKADPCNDFYGFVCGKNDKPIGFAELEQRNIQEIADKIKDYHYRTEQPKPVKQIITAIESCLAARHDWANFTKNNRYVHKKLDEFTNLIQIKPPILNQDQPDPTNLSPKNFGEALGYLEGNFAIPTFISAITDTNWKFPHGTQPYALYIDQSTLYYPRVIYERAWNYVKDDYLNSTIAVMNLLKSGLDQTKLKKDVEDIIDLEYTIYKEFSKSDSERSHFASSYNRITLFSVQNNFPFIDWSVYFKQMVKHANEETRKFIENPSFAFILTEPEILKKLNDFITTKKLSARTVINYFYYRIVMEYEEYLSLQPVNNEILSRVKKNKYPFPRKPGPPRVFPVHNSIPLKSTKEENICVPKFLQYFPYATGRIFIDAVLPSTKERDILRHEIAKMIDAILVGFRSMLEELNWMDDTTKYKANEKIEYLVRNIAYPDFITDNELLDVYYDSLDIEDTDTYDMIIDKAEYFNLANKYNILSKKAIQRDEFISSPGIVNAWYQPERNSITFPLGILRSPFYEKDWPSSYIYGSIGAIAGHELTHAFDDQGIQWDATGVLNEWMTGYSYKSFKEMADCVINEYSKFCPFNGTERPVKCLDGFTTQGENIADNGGIHTAYRAFKFHENRNGPEPLLNDQYLKQFTHDQLFFIAFARTWCGSMDNDALQFQILTNVHSPAKYRVLGTIQNYPAFRAAFQCPIGSNYAPKDHCNVWVSENADDFGVPKYKIKDELNIPPAEQIQPVGEHEKSYDDYYETAEILKRSMNLSRDPCDNFYEYTCESFKESSQFSSSAKRNLQIMANQMEKSEYDRPDTPSALTKTKLFYTKCKAARSKFEELIKDGAIIKEELKQFNIRTELEFSMITNQSFQGPQNVDPVTLGNAVGYLSARGIDTLITPVIDTDWKTAQNYRFFIDQNTLTYPKSYYESDPWDFTHADFKKNVIDLFNQYADLLKIKLNQTILDDDVTSLLEFERKLAMEYSTKEVERREFARSYNLYAVEELHKLYEFINFYSYFNNLADEYDDYAKYFNDKRQISLMEVAMIKKISEDFKNFDSNVVANYFFYRLLLANKEYLPKPSNYKEIPIMVHEERPRIGRRIRNFNLINDKSDDVRLFCAEETIQHLPYANARFLVDALYPSTKSRAEMQKSIRNITKNILLSFQGMINRLDWMDPASKNGSYAKIDQIRLNIAYPEFILNDDSLDEYYKKAYIRPDQSYFVIIKVLRRFNYYLQADLLVQNKKVDRKDFLGPPGIVNAWYQPELNSITLPLGIINTIFYNSYRPNSVNYGMLGLVIGHELTHGFDDLGVQWDELGILHEWMTEASKKEFNKMTKCVIKQYSNFCPLRGSGYSPECIDGDQTQSENIADNGGINAAWVAYENYVALNGPDERLPDPKYSHLSHDQLFFLAFGEAWCRKTPSNEDMYKQIMTDVHSPAKYRILGTIQNHPAFRLAFNCKKGSIYGPKEFCSVWVPERS